MKTIAAAILILISIHCQAQHFENPGSFRLGSSYLSFDDMNSNPVLELEFNINIYEYFSLDYRLGAGYKYFHSPLTTPLVTLLAIGGAASEDSSAKSLLYVGAILALLIPEGVSGHIPLGNGNYISPSIAPLGFEYLGRNNNSDKQTVYAAGNFGIKYDHFINKQWFFSIQSIYKVAYSRENRDGYMLGFQIGKSF